MVSVIFYPVISVEEYLYTVSLAGLYTALQLVNSELRDDTLRSLAAGNHSFCYCVEIDRGVYAAGKHGRCSSHH